MPGTTPWLPQSHSPLRDRGSSVMPSEFSFLTGTPVSGNYRLAVARGPLAPAAARSASAEMAQPRSMGPLRIGTAVYFAGCNGHSFPLYEFFSF